MASWEDEDFADDVALSNTNEFGEEAEELMGDWEAGLESDDDKPKVAKPKVSSAERVAARKAKEQEERERKALEKTSEASLAEQREKEVQSDLNNASDLLAAADIHPRSRKTDAAAAPAVSAGPTKLSDLAIFKVTNAKEYTDLRKTLVPVINKLQENKVTPPLMHSNFVIETCRDLCKPLTSDQVQKVISTLTAVANEKAREERAKRLNNRAKPQIKQASAKQTASAEVDILADDGLDDDDFM